MKDTLSKVFYRAMLWTLVLGYLLIVNYGHDHDPMMWLWVD